MPLLVVGSTWNMPASSVHTFHGACCTATSRVVPGAPQSATGRLRYRGAPERWIFTYPLAALGSFARRREPGKKNRATQKRKDKARATSRTAV